MPHRERQKFAIMLGKLGVQWSLPSYSTWCEAVIQGKQNTDTLSHQAHQGAWQQASMQLHGLTDTQTDRLTLWGCLPVWEAFLMCSSRFREKRPLPMRPAAAKSKQHRVRPTAGLLLTMRTVSATLIWPQAVITCMEHKITALEEAKTSQGALICNN